MATNVSKLTWDPKQGSEFEVDSQDFTSSQDLFLSQDFIPRQDLSSQKDLDLRLTMGDEGESNSLIQGWFNYFGRCSPVEYTRPGSQIFGMSVPSTLQGHLISHPIYLAAPS